MATRHLLAAVFLVAIACGCAQVPEDGDTIFQVSTINALLEGVYDGDISLGGLKRHGDFGVGAADELDGELVELGGEIYQLKVDGLAYPAEDSLKTPFAVVTFFEPDNTVLSDRSMDYNQLKEYLDGLLPTENIPYAVKMEGTFNYVKTRGLPRQKKPYPRLVEVVKKESKFEFHDVNGTMVGFWFPAYMEGINVPHYHFHFITEDRKKGGHVLDCEPRNVRIGIDNSPALYMVLNEHGEFYSADLTETEEKKAELEEFME